VVRLSTAYLTQLDHGVGEHWSGPPELMDHLVRLLDPRPTTRVLDVGCGIGGPARRLGELRDCTIVALDLLADVVSAARAGGPGGRISFLVGDAEHLPLAASSFDHVLALGVVAHTSFDAFARETHRVLADGGVFAAVEVLWTGRAPPHFVRSAPQPWTPYRPNEVRDALARAGFTSVELSTPEELRDAEPRDVRLRQDLAEGSLAPSVIIGRAA
jgi:SAM-dependent methyltransferase